MQTTTETTTSTEVKAVIIGKFPGMLGAFQLNCFNTLIAAGISRQVSHKVALDFGSDIGNLMKNDPDVAQKIGKMRKDGESSLRISASGKVSKTSRAMSLTRVAQVIGDLFKEGLLSDREITNLSTDLQDYIAESEDWAKAQTFADK